MNLSAIQTNLKLLENTTINYSRAGGGAGSILLVTTNNDISIWVWCYWEIRLSDVVLATADDDTTAVVGKIAVAARQLEGKKIIRVEMDPTYYDLHIFIEGDYELIINCESQPDGEDTLLNNWELWIKDKNTAYTITCDFTIIETPYEIK